jgi:medium-chain acyl-[acyl-carrier-protein] hydrolase
LETVLENGELMELLLPTLRADFTLIGTYTYSYDAPLRCSISAFGGLQDCSVDFADLEAWDAQTRQNLKVRMFAGDHFFLHSAHHQSLWVVSQDLMHVLERQQNSHL